MLYGVVLVALYWLQARFFYLPERLPANFAFAYPDLEEERWWTTEDGVRIHGLYFRTPRPRRGAVLYLHGNAGSLRGWAGERHPLTRRGYDVLMIDYRGYGKSEGTPSEAGLYADARAAYAWLRERFAPHEIVIYGRSLGSGPATQLATEVDARHLILETPFYSLESVARSKVAWLWLPFAFSHRYENGRKIPELQMPVDIFHGTADRVVPYANAVRLRPLVPAASFTTVPGGGHSGLVDYPAVQQVLDRVLGT